MKIEKIIDKCSDCMFCIEMVNLKNNHQVITVCSFPDVAPFITCGGIYSYKIKGVEEIKIPDNCPLEDYKKTDTL